MVLMEAAMMVCSTRTRLPTYKHIISSGTLACLDEYPSGLSPPRAEESAA